MVRPTGYVSRKTAPTRVTVVVVFGLVITMDNVEMSLTLTVAGEKLFATVGAPTTVNGAEAGLPGVASPVRVTPEVVLINAPGDTPVTCLVIVQLAPMPNSPPENAKLDVASAATTVPPQVVVAANAEF